MQLTTPTLQVLLTNVSRMLNVSDPTNSFWTQAELTEYINEGVRIYFSECVLANEGNFLTQADLNIVLNTQTVALPSDCFQVKILYKKVSDGYTKLNYRNNMTQGYSTVGGSAGDSYTPSYEFQGNNLFLSPIPNFSETAGLRIEYVAFPDQMIWGGDLLTAQVSPIFKQVLEMYAVYKAKLKESLVNGVAMHKVAEDNLNTLYKLFKDTITKRSRDPQFVVPFNPETDGIG